MGNVSHMSTTRQSYWRHSAIRKKELWLDCRDQTSIVHILTADKGIPEQAANLLLNICVVTKSIICYPGSFAHVFDIDFSFGSPNFSRPRRENWQADFMFDSVTLPIVLFIVYAPGPGPAVGLFDGCLELVLNPISASLLYTEVLLNASMTVLFEMNGDPGLVNP